VRPPVGGLTSINASRLCANHHNTPALCATATMDS
jgi:hypothetical protein